MNGNALPPMGLSANANAEEQMPIWKAVILLFLVMGMTHLDELWMQFALSVIINVVAFGIDKRAAILTLLLFPSLFISTYGWIVLNGFKILLIVTIVLNLLGIGKKWFPN